MQISGVMRGKTEFYRKPSYKGKLLGKGICNYLIVGQKTTMEDLNYEKRNCEN